MALRPDKTGRALVAVVATAALLSGCGAGPPPPAVRHVSREFFGLSATAVLDSAGSTRRRGLKAIAASGAALVRQTFDWAQIEKRAGRFDFSGYDLLIGDTSRAGLAVLPILFHPPGFRAPAPPRGSPNVTFPPQRNADMARFAAAVVRRYGPHGSFWAEHPSVPRRPIADWQVWNEPNLPAYWGGHPDARGYVRLLKVVGSAIRRADPGAEVVSAGLPNSRIGVPFASYLRSMYAAGARGAFDVLAIHPYAGDAESVIGALQSARALTDGLGDGRVPLWVTELGWASDGPPSAFTVGAGGQADRIQRALSGLAARRRALNLRGVIYYAWQDAPPYPRGSDFFGLHTGLLERSGKRKPAYATWVHTVQELTR